VAIQASRSSDSGSASSEGSASPNIEHWLQLQSQVRQVVHEMNNLLTAAGCRVDLLPEACREREVLLQLLSQMQGLMSHLGTVNHRALQKTHSD